MNRMILLGGVLALVVVFVGCEGKTNALSTDSGKMTVQEYEAMQAAEEKKISESMNAPAK